MFLVGVSFDVIEASLLHRKQSIHGRLTGELPPGLAHRQTEHIVLLWHEPSVPW